jgi:hypothetical protein
MQREAMVISVGKVPEKVPDTFSPDTFSPKLKLSHRPPGCQGPPSDASPRGKSGKKWRAG